VAGRNRPVTTYLPDVLITMVQRYQYKRSIPRFNQAVIELLESHPQIQQIAAEILDEAVMRSL
jgi:hypothetical protein